MRSIAIRGARENNLRDVSLDVPEEALTVFVGVSGSGKSSLVLGTIARESQRQLMEIFPAYVRDRLPKASRPEVASIEGLTPAVVVDQRPVTGNVRSTVGTMTDISTLVRILFSRLGEPSAGESSAYSFNDPSGMCLRCDGLGRTRQVMLDRLVDERRSLNEGAIRFPAYAPGSVRWQIYADTGILDPDVPIAELGDDERQLFLRGEGFKVQRGTRVGRSETGNVYEGLLDNFERLYLRRDPRELGEQERAALADVVREAPCEECGGQRLNAAARASTINGRNIAELSALEVTDLLDELRRIQDPLAAPLVEAAIAGLRRLDEIGLGYLSLDRPVPTLSGGEAQRLKTVRHLGSALTGMTYVFDEPSVGLHPRDVCRLVRLLAELRDNGNTVLVVEHDRDVIESADHVVELGPGAGTAGGTIVFAGAPSRLQGADTETSRGLGRAREINRRPRIRTGELTIRDARLHNLRGVTVSIPTGVLTAVTGVAGSGKSTLVAEVLPEQHPGVTVVDQSPVGITPRATPASYLGALDHIRRRFAAESGTEPGLFSFNAAGACPTCGGRGVVSADLAYMPAVTRTCEACGGHRYGPQALEHRWGGRTIVEVLALTVEDALRDIDDAAVRDRLHPLSEVGLGYLALGRSLDTLSGGERQRLKIASLLADATATLVLDEPTTGLHIADIEGLLGLVDRLLERGMTIIAIEHDTDLIRRADWIIDLGPDAGRDGGRIVFEGTPEQLLAFRGSHTADHLRRACTTEAIRRTASATSSALVPKFRRANPAPSGP